MSEYVMMFFMACGSFALFLGWLVLNQRMKQWSEARAQERNEREMVAQPERNHRAVPTQAPPTPSAISEAIITPEMRARLLAAKQAYQERKVSDEPQPTPQPTRTPLNGTAEERTRNAAANLPHVTLGDRLKPTAQLIPFLFDGDRWHGVNLHGQKHWKFCGQTGSGKGNAMQLVALDILNLGEREAHVWIFDPKDGLDYRSFAPKLAHAKLFADVWAIDPRTNEIRKDETGNPQPKFDGTITAGYNLALKEMRRRSQIIGDADCRNLAEYNAKHPSQALPVLVLVCDEVADLTDDQREMLCTLVRMSRSSGIVIFVCTQYPTADVLPSQIQANVSNNITLRFDSPKYNAVALGVLPGEKTVYIPSAIAESGVCIYRHAGSEIIGRIPELTPTKQREMIAHLVATYPRREGDPKPLLVESVKSPEMVLGELLGDTSFPIDWTPRHQRLAVWLFAQLVGGRKIDPTDLSIREIAKFLYPDKDHGGGGGYSKLAKDALIKVLPVVNTWCEVVNLQTYEVAEVA